MKFHRMYALSLRHIYLIKSSLPRILDLIYWPTIQIVLWGFISKFFTLHSDYYNHTLGIILSAAILYDFLFRSSISFNMLFLEEIWSRNFTNLFIAPLKISEIIIDQSLMLSSFKKTSPSSGFTTPDKILTSVDFPAPFSPNNAYIFPLPNSNDTLSFAIHPG